MNVLPEWSRVPEKVRRDRMPGNSESGVLDGCEASSGCWEEKLEPPEEHPLLSISEPSLQPEMWLCFEMVSLHRQDYPGTWSIRQTGLELTDLSLPHAGIKSTHHHPLALETWLLIKENGKVQFPERYTTSNIIKILNSHQEFLQRPQVFHKLTSC